MKKKCAICRDLKPPKDDRWPRGLFCTMCGFSRTYPPLKKKR